MDSPKNKIKVSTQVQFPTIIEKNDCLPVKMTEAVVYFE